MYLSIVKTQYKTQNWKEEKPTLATAYNHIFVFGTLCLSQGKKSDT